MVFPLARRRGHVGVLLVPGEEPGDGQGGVGLHGARDQVELGAPRSHQCVGAAQVDEQPLLEEVLGVVREEGALADELHPAFHLELGLAAGQASTVQLGSHSLGREAGKLANELCFFSRIRSNEGYRSTMTTFGYVPDTALSCLPKSCWHKVSRTPFIVGYSSTDGQF